MVRNGEEWRAATASEVIDAAFGSASEEIRRETGLRFGRVALTPNLLLEGTLPDAVTIRAGVWRGSTFVPVFDKATQGVVVDGRWHPLDMLTLQNAYEVLTRHGLKQGSRVSFGTYLELNADPEGAGLTVNRVSDDGFFAFSSSKRDLSSIGLQINLFPYQEAGVEYMSAMAERDVGVLLADQMGLGKTAQAIALLLDQRPKGCSLVVCPASLLRNWARELEQVAPGLQVLSHSGPLRTGVASGFSGYDLVVTSYDTLVSDRGLFADVAWNVLLLDEAQTIRNPDTNRSQAVKAMHRRLSVALTGTPVENRLLDLWSIAEFVVPALLGMREPFEEAFPDELERARSLGRVVSPVTIRRLVSEVATDLPELMESETAFELPLMELERYREIISNSSSPLAATTQLRVLCAHADGIGWRAGHRSPKVEHTLDTLAEIFTEGQKALVFASFQDSLDSLFNSTVESHPSVFLAVLDGRVPVSERQSVIDLFSAFDGAGALFLNPQAAGVGLNITAANHVIHFNPEWNPALTSQATARAFRRKQRLPVTVHHYYYEGTVEQDAMLRADWKRELAGGVDDGTTVGAEGGINGPS